MMTSFDYNYQNALRQAIVFSILSFVCVTQIYDIVLRLAVQKLWARSFGTIPSILIPV